MNPAYFITGTDTDVGKTTVAAGFLYAARAAGLSTELVESPASLRACCSRPSWRTVSSQSPPCSATTWARVIRLLLRARM